MAYHGAARIIPGTTQSIAYSATHGEIVVAFVPGCTRIRVTCTSDAFVAVDKAPVAIAPVAGTTPGDMPVFAQQPEYFLVSPGGGEKVSAVQSSASGILYVTQCQ